MDLGKGKGKKENGKMKRGIKKKNESDGKIEKIETKECRVERELGMKIKQKKSDIVKLRRERWIDRGVRNGEQG